MKNTFTSYQQDGCYLTILLTSKKEVDVNNVMNIIVNQLIMERSVVSSKVTETNKKISGFGKNRNFYSSIEFTISDNFIYITDRDVNIIKKKCKLSFVAFYVKAKCKEINYQIL